MADGAAPPVLIRGTPRSRQAHLSGDLLLMAESAALYALPGAQAAALRAAMERGEAAVTARLAALGLTAAAAPALSDDLADDLSDAAPGPVRALALTVAQGCNMACGYCYAAGGAFGGAVRQMPPEVARAAIDRLIEAAPPGGAVQIAFMGGEPWMAKGLIRDAVIHARRRAAARAVRTGFSMTTNATLLRAEDAAFLAEHRFAVTVSLDGDRAANDRLRPMAGGGGSFDRVAARLGPLLEQADRLRLSARVTVTPDNLDIPRTVAALSALGFDTIGVSPMLASPTGKGALGAADFPRLLEAMIAAGEDWLEAIIAGRPHGFANLATALGELHRGQPRSVSCGAVRDYLAVDAEGNYAACHRFVNDPLGAMGDLSGGPDAAARAAFLAERRVEAQPGCAGCWARRLCGGGCHHEVLHAGRPACDYVRGWLDYAISAYGRLMAARPDWFGDA
ncbi:radical SAM/SPASM domain-containing protein [Mangrovicoccus algicola]|uniref:Radical SAM protein n=1 Tax=Mangrovicoccus algicola TaxID=2771008 RepID=A0A8J7CWV8_9RHOB|nr:radical SAM protein [Mangrovicoccus algicola]MBE3638232.1 radical SAM protein [Mangrovicoccus algicola]